MRKTILLAFDDPGGGLAVSSLIKRLSEEKNLDLKIFSGKLSEKFLTGKKTEFNKIDSFIEKSQAENLITELKPDLIVTGTGGGNAEQELRNAAFRNNISSVVILDFWKDYERRWLYSDYKINNLEDKICVMDVVTKSEMLEEKFPEEKIFVTGHPYLDFIFNYEDHSERSKKSSDVGIETFLYLSQPFEIIGVREYKTHPLKILLKALEKISSKRKKKIIINIKLHPSEKISEELKTILKEFVRENLKLNLIDETDNIKELIEESDIVIGYNTIAMFEARAMSKRTISLDASEIRNSLAEAMKTAGIERVEINEEKIFELLMSQPFENEEKKIFRGGIENCVSIILSELKIN